MFSMSEKELGKSGTDAWQILLLNSAEIFAVTFGKYPSETAIQKTGSGLGLGIVFSVLFFKRRTWPISFGSGAGLGMAYANCQNDLRLHYLQPRRQKE